MFETDYETVSGADRAEILADANRALPTFPFADDDVQIERAELPFYAAAGEQRFRLLKFSSRANTRNAPLFALYSPAAIHPLDGSDTPVYTVNALAPFALPAEHGKAVEVACDYLEFFLYFTVAQHGLYLPEEPGDNGAFRPINVVIEDEGTAAARVRRVELQGDLVRGTVVVSSGIAIEADGKVRFHNETTVRTGVPPRDSNRRVGYRTDIGRISPVHWVSEWERIEPAGTDGGPDEETGHNTYTRIVDWYCNHVQSPKPEKDELILRRGAISSTNGNRKVSGGISWTLSMPT